LKKVISIGLLLVLFFNIGGYYLVFWGLKRTASLELIHQLDNNQYSERETVELKIPLSLPYPPQQNGYERINGEFDYQQKHFKLVKQKLERDTLFVVCIQDKEAEKITQELNAFTKVTQEVPLSGKQKSSLISQLIKEYSVLEAIEIENEVSGWSKVNAIDKRIPNTITQNFPTPAPPPKSFC